MTNPGQADFRLHLQEELVKRCKQNPAYSMRAFSRALDLESSFLSKLLKGSRKITPKLVSRLSAKLALDPAEMARFQGKNLPSGASLPGAATLTSTAEFQQLNQDHFQVIADWYHYAILELLTVQSFEPNPRWIARSLGISPAEAVSALERLKRLGMIEVGVKGKLRQPKNFTTVGSPYSASALKKLQRQILEKALLALDETPMDERDQGAITMAIDSRLLPEAKKRTREFRRELCAFLQDGRRRDRVYQLSVSLYPVSQKPKGKHP